jgi:hypothetical protein
VIRNKLKIAIASGLVIVVSSVGGIAIASGFSGVPDTGGGPGDAPAPTGYSGINDPSLNSCLAAQRQCNPQAAAELQNNPWSSPLPVGASVMSRLAVEQFVRRTIGAASSAPAFSQYLTGAEAIQILDIQRNSNVDESRPIWIVTVNANIETDGSPASKPMLEQYYSAIVDAGSGQITDDCIGCRWLTASS